MDAEHDIDATQQGYSPADFWGEEVWSEGYAAIPQRLLRGANRLKLDAIDQALVFHLLSFKWTAGAPWPSVATLAERLGMGESAVRRRLRRLHKQLELVVREDRPGRTNEYNLQPLASALRALGPGLAPARRGGRPERPGGAGPQRPPTLGPSAHRTRTTEEHYPEKEQHNNVIASLQREGVKGSVALGLVADCGEEACRRQLEWLPYRQARNPAAVLVDSIREGWGPPKGF